MKKLLSFIALSSIMLLFSLFAEAYPVKVTSPNGAPALALASLAQQNPENYTYITAETIAAEFAGNKADFIIAPINAGAKLFKMGKSSYKLAAVVTWGNLYFASQKKNFKLKDIKKSEVTLFGENTINASVALAALQKNKLAPKSITYLGSAAATQALLLADSTSVVLTAEPILSAAKIKNKAITSYALNDLYKKATGFDGFAQAGLFVRAETIEQHPEEVAEFLKLAQESCAKCTSDVPAVAKAAAQLEIMPNAKIAESAIPNCAIHFLSAKEAKAQVETTANLDIKQYGGALPAPEFYYGE
jgi:NitT/TauT family transport system substrate-binding protein